MESKQVQHSSSRRIVLATASAGVLLFQGSSAFVAPKFQSSLPAYSPNPFGTQTTIYDPINHAARQMLPDLKQRISRRNIKALIMSAEPLVVGMFGGGTVGGGVYQICKKKQELFKSLGADVRIKKICVKSLNKPRDFVVDSETEVVTDYSAILDDPEINCIVEVMGGVTDAKTVLFGALSKGKHVVTANKALLAKYLPELQDLLARNPQASFGFEAAVCGGIPIIHTLQQDYLGDDICKVLGIMNGTTNFMLTKMANQGADYADVLKEAQALGFAEADPTADVEGHDVQAKIALVAKLAFGVSVPMESIPTVGISSVSSIDFQYAAAMGSTIKLAGCAKLNGNRDQLSVYVSPVIVPKSHPLASANFATNIVEITSENMGSTSYVGPGAGRFPTANSIVNDILRAARGETTAPFPVNTKLPIQNDYFCKHYIRVKVRDGLGITRVVGELAEKHGISINAILQNPITDHNNVDFVVTTEEARVSAVKAFCSDLSEQPFSLQRPVVMTLL